MRRNFFLAGSLTMMVAACFAATPELKHVRRVYFLQMTSGMDQYLAQHLIKGNTLEVVTDPALADAIFSDRIGESLEQKWAEVYPPPKPVEEEKSDADKVKDKDTDKDADKKKEAAMMSSGAVRGASTWGRGRGNIYLIDRKSRVVIWSAYNKPKNSTAREMDRTANRVIGHLKNDLGMKTMSVKQ